MLEQEVSYPLGHLLTQPPTAPSQLEDVQTSAGLGLVMLPELTKKDPMCDIIPAAPQSHLETIGIQK